MIYLINKFKLSGPAFVVKTIKYFFIGVFSAVLLLQSCSKQVVVKTTRYFEHIPVICYHHVNPSEALKNNYINTVPTEFEEQIKYLHSSGYRTILSKDIPAVLAPAEINIFGDNNKPVLINFDDGYKSVYKYAYTIMKKFGYKGILSFL